MPRTFTIPELYSLTIGEYNAMTQDDRDEYNRTLYRHWADAADAEVSKANAKDREEGNDYA